MIRLSQNRCRIQNLSADSGGQVYRLEGRYPTRPAFFSWRAAKAREREPAGLQGVLTSNGPDWQQFRRAVQAPLLRPDRAASRLPLLLHTRHLTVYAVAFLAPYILPACCIKQGSR